MSTSDISEELVRHVVCDLKERYRLDDAALRALGERLAEWMPHDQRQIENVAFAERFTSEHRDTFDRLAR